MDHGIYIAASGSLKQERMMDTVANNLANVNTDGFKKDLLAFEAIPPDFNRSRQAGAAPRSQPPGPEYLYPALAGSRTDFSPGQIINTGNPLDIALNGKGFLVVRSPEGLRYMRSGSFRFNKKRELVTPEGNPVMGKAGPIRVLPAAKDFIIDKTGKVVVSNGFRNTPVGDLKIVDFPDPSALKKVGVNLFRETGAKSQAGPAKNVEVLQGGLESSNVNIAAEMIKMIEVTRGYESYQRVIQTIDGLNNKAVNEVGRVA